MHAEPDNGEFARILAAIQQRTGLSHQRIADAAGVDRSQVWRWVRAGSNPGYEPVRRLAAWLIAERPEVADAAAQLLPAAGYETAPGVAAPADGWTPTLDAAKVRQARPHADRIWQRLRELALQGIAEPSGEQMFGPGTLDAADWDRATGLKAEEKVWLVAILQAGEAAARSPGQGTGTALPGLYRS